MNGDSNFKTLVYNNSQKYKSAFVEKILRENILYENHKSKLISSSTSSATRTFLDDAKLKSLNAILSNLQYDTIKKINEKYLLEQTTSLLNGNQSSSSSSNGTKKTDRSFSSTSTTPNTAVNNALNKPELIKPKKLINFKNERIKSSNKIHPTSSSNETKKTLLTSSTNEPLNLANSSQIVIHVCDEARRLKQDFTCPRDLLVREMKYFSYNLNINVSNTSHNTSGAHAHSSIPTSALSKKSLDEIDISVHCDINIFDWLMRYVKRNHPYLIEKTIASPSTETLAEALKSYEPKLEVNNCVSILLSSDFLIMGDLVDKCIVFIAQNLEAVLQIQCVLNGISDYIITKLAACVHTKRLDTIYDKKDKLKTKLFQRKIEFLFDPAKYKSQFENSPVLNNWKNDRTNPNELKNGDRSDDTITDNTSTNTNNNNNENENHSIQLDNYTNYLYECENDASTLFKCKLCSKLMTKQQALNLKCQLAILNAHGDYIYLHVPDDTFDMTNFLKLLKEKFKTWQSVYWFLWALVKSFKCRKCNQWFRLVDLNRCRLNEQTYCSIHDGKNSLFINNIKNSASSSSSSTDTNTCTCIYINHILESSAFTSFYSSSPVCLDDIHSNMSNEQKLARYLDHIMEDLDKHGDIIFHGKTLANRDVANDSISICEIIEDFIQTDKFKNVNINTSSNSNTNTNSSTLSMSTTSSLITNRILKLLPKTPIETYECGFFIDSITGKHISLLDKHMLNLIKLAQLLHSSNSDSNQGNNNNIISQSVAYNNYNISSIVNTNLDFKTILFLINYMDVRNVFNSLEALHFLRITNKMKWDCSKPVRFNQDNQREDDLKKFREISSYLIRAKLVDEYQKPPALKSSITNLLMQQQNSSNLVSSSPGGMYCRIENEWKIRRN